MMAMTFKDAVHVLKNTAWHGTDRQIRRVEKAIETIEAEERKGHEKDVDMAAFIIAGFIIGMTAMFACLAVANQLVMFLP